MYFSKGINEKLSGIVIRCHYFAVLVRQKNVAIISCRISDVGEIVRIHTYSFEDLFYLNSYWMKKLRRFAYLSQSTSVFRNVSAITLLYEKYVKIDDKRILEWPFSINFHLLIEIW